MYDTSRLDGAYAGQSIQIFAKLRPCRGGQFQATERFLLSAGAARPGVRNWRGRACNKDGFSLKTYASDDDKKEAEKKTDEEKEADALTPYGERDKKYDDYRLPGAIFKLKVDNTHPLGFGYPKHYFTIKNNSSRYAYLPNGWNVGIVEGSDSHVSGVAGDKVKESLAKSLVFGVENMGGGSIVYMADNPLFRAFWENGKLFVANALFMVGQ